MKKFALSLCFLSLFLVNLFSQGFTREIDIKTPRMNGQDVELLQKRLLKLGFKGVGEVDGYYGPKTGDAIKFIKFIFFSMETEPYRDRDASFDYLVDRQLWEIIFDRENTKKLNAISLIKPFYDDGLHEENPARNPKVTGFKETLLHFDEGLNEEYGYYWFTRKIKREYFYNKNIHIIENITEVHEGYEHDRYFTLPNGITIIEHFWSGEGWGGTTFTFSNR